MFVLLYTFAQTSCFSGPIKVKVGLQKYKYQTYKYQPETLKDGHHEKRNSLSHLYTTPKYSISNERWF